MKSILSLLLLSAAVALLAADSDSQGKLAPKPLFRDPVHDGAADPVLVWNRAEKRWFMLYTNRRADLKDSKGVEWVHGTRIGIAESTDGGATWKYRGVANIDYGKPDYSHWAPDVIDDGRLYHMYLSVVPGTFADWNAPRDIVHLTSTDLLNWKYVSILKLASDRVIDATVARIPGGNWRLWYKNERDKSHIYAADSPDLNEWVDRGPVITDRAGEGAKVFFWKGRYWMITDMWRGLAVYSSPDAGVWAAQTEPVLQEPGTSPTDREQGRHADVVVSGERAWVFYFTHLGGADAVPGDPFSKRRSVIQVAELEYRDGRLVCDRNKPTRIDLAPPVPSAKPARR